MKLLLCGKCGSVFSLSKDREKSCDCGDTKGQYIDNLSGWYSGDAAVPLGFHNYSFLSAVGRQPHIADQGEDFVAFVIPKVCSTFTRK